MHAIIPGSSLFHRMGRHFDVVIIDEAAQAVEPSVLVPLVMGCKQVCSVLCVLCVLCVCLCVYRT